LKEVKVVELEEPVGWVNIPLVDRELRDLYKQQSGGIISSSNFNYGTRAHFIQVCIVSMHQNGRDTHVRQARIYGPRTEGGGWGKNEIPFKNTQFTMFDSIR